MGANETHVTAITRAIGKVTSIFRCRGLQPVSPNADRIGGHDLLYWTAFLALLSAWYLFLYMPQCRRYERLVGRQQSLVLQLESEKKELARLQQGIENLHNGDALAWERVARKRFGWLEPGEVLDTEKWLQTRGAVATGGNGAPAMGVRPHSAPPAPVLPRPRVPQIPHPQQSVPSIFTPISAPVPRAFADTGALGPTRALPPPEPPQVPAIPPSLQRPGFSFARHSPAIQSIAYPRSN